ncbi:MAG: hsp70 family protein [Pirellulales bacterium]|nr:hsp70 family protein [Pirellulales bacterium]
MPVNPPATSTSDLSPARFIVGIDLGTTNSAVASVDTQAETWAVTTFRVPQLVAPGEVEARETLPSFHYVAGEGELSGDALRLPWSSEPSSSVAARHVVGVLAREHGTAAPGRLIVSAKSWLCHSGVDRTAGLLPWQGAADVQRLSPVAASASYLEHIRRAWDAAHPQDPLAEQDVVLTLPASFDEVARELTVKAAATAGLPRVMLIEEPQAAFYAWIDKHRDHWEELVTPGQKILVCDCGGGTSDFTLIRVRQGEGGKVQFHRVAVGQHLILGGDNLDLALAHHLEKRLADGGQLDPRTWSVLVRTCRQAKETLLADDAPERTTLNLPGVGAKLIGGGRQVDVTRDEARQVLLDGFFPLVKLDDKPAARRSGFQEFGLPYAPDAAVTRYLAAFLSAHRHVALEVNESAPAYDPARPDIVLFNGGLFESSAIRRRVIDVLRAWFGGDDGSWTPIVLENERLHLAVARGAAYYGMVRRGQGVRIAAALARTYYVGVEGPEPAAVCLVPASVEPGSDVTLAGRQFDLLVASPVEFPLFVSSTRLTDPPGALVGIDREQMTPLPPIRTVLRKRKKTDPDTVRVTLHARLTEIGTLELWCSQVDGPRRWQLQFDVRAATQTDAVAHQSAAEGEGVVDESIWEECWELIEGTFSGNKGVGSLCFSTKRKQIETLSETKTPDPFVSQKPSGLVKRLAAVTEMSRQAWPTSLLRRIWEALMANEAGRRRSEQHEARWLNLLGFALRPGYGLAADDWRVAETWRTLQGRLHHSTVTCRAEWWILWRRIAGGLLAGQQQALADPILGPVRALHRQSTTGKGRGGEFSAGSHETAEVWRLLGSLELLPTTTKIELGHILLDLLPKPKMETVRTAIAWAVGRIGARQPVYGPMDTVVPVDTVQNWLTRLMDFDEDEPMLRLAVMQLSRKTDDRYRDLPEKFRNKVLRWLEAHDAPAHHLALVERVGQLDEDEQGLVFGESLPVGLRII